MGVEQSVDDAVVAPVGRAQERARVVDDRVDRLLAVGILGVIQPSETEDCRVDLDRVDPRRSAAQRRRHVVAGPRPDDRHVPRRAVDPVGELVVVPLPAQVLAGRDVRVAVRQVVHALVVVPGRPHHHQAVLDRGRLEQLVGRVDPLPQRVHRPGQDDDGGERGDRLDDERAGTPHREERETREEEPEPDRRRSPEEADREHEGDAHEASEQVQAVGGQVLAALHRPPAELAHGNEGEKRTPMSRPNWTTRRGAVRTSGIRSRGASA